MTIDEIKSVSIVQFLETEGFQYAYIHRGNYWYLSPFRAESSPSFNVSPTKNRLHLSMSVLQKIFGMTLEPTQEETL